MKKRIKQINGVLMVIIIMLLVVIYNRITTTQNNITRNDKWQQLTNQIAISRIHTESYSFVEMKTGNIDERYCIEKNIYSYAIKNNGETPVVIEQTDVVITFNEQQVMTKAVLVETTLEGEEINRTEQTYPLIIAPKVTETLHIMYEERLNNIHKKPGVDPRSSEINVKLFLVVDGQTYAIDTEKELIIGCATSETGE